MRCSPILGSRITALVGQDVKRTFSAVGANFTGLPCQDTHEASGQQLGELRNALIFGSAFWLLAGTISRGHLALSTMIDFILFDIDQVMIRRGRHGAI
jgi:hypothetical protein